MQQTMEQTYSEKNNSRKLQKAKLQNLPHIGNYLYGIYIVLGITSSLEVILSLWEYVHMLYANTVPFFYIWDLSILRFWNLWERLLEPILFGYQGTTVIITLD